MKKEFVFLSLCFLFIYLTLIPVYALTCNERHLANCSLSQSGNRICSSSSATMIEVCTSTSTDPDIYCWQTIYNCAFMGDGFACVIGSDGNAGCDDGSGTGGGLYGVMRIGCRSNPSICKASSCEKCKFDYWNPADHGVCKSTCKSGETCTSRGSCTTSPCSSDANCKELEKCESCNGGGSGLTGVCISDCKAGEKCDGAGKCIPECEDSSVCGVKCCWKGAASGGQCIDRCSGRICGQDINCEDVQCGSCEDGKSCLSGRCFELPASSSFGKCIPNCLGKSCGSSDGCGGKCAGSCPLSTDVCLKDSSGGFSCCATDCSGVTCGLDKCGTKLCDNCGVDSECKNSGGSFSCQLKGSSTTTTCTPHCLSPRHSLCGSSDGCGGRCNGLCRSEEFCDNFKGWWMCRPEGCQGKECGSGSNGWSSCGTCSGDTYCHDGKCCKTGDTSCCVPITCAEVLPRIPDWSCGNFEDGCGGRIYCHKCPDSTYGCNGRYCTFPPRHGMSLASCSGSLCISPPLTGSSYFIVKESDEENITSGIYYKLEPSGVNFSKGFILKIDYSESDFNKPLLVKYEDWVFDNDFFGKTTLEEDNLTIGFDGGGLSVYGALVEIPAGALSQDYNFSLKKIRLLEIYKQNNLRSSLFSNILKLLSRLFIGDSEISSAGIAREIVNWVTS